MTIHSDHPFSPGDTEKNAVRRLRGRLLSPVTVVATGTGRNRVGLTVSSLLVVDGDPGKVIVLVDPDSDFGEAAEVGVRAAVSLLESADEFLAEAFAGLAPAPGGPFTLGDWVDSAWGPHLADHSWCGFEIEHVRPVGWSLELLGGIESVEIAGPGGLGHFRGRYFTN